MALTFDYSNALNVIRNEEIDRIKASAELARETLLQGNGAGSDFLGWINLPATYDRVEFARIKDAANKIRKDSDVLIVIGIGGSYLGARAVIEFMQHSFQNSLPYDKKEAPDIYFAGNSLSSAYL